MKKHNRIDYLPSVLVHAILIEHQTIHQEYSDTKYIYRYCPTFLGVNNCIFVCVCVCVSWQGKGWVEGRCWEVGSDIYIYIYIYKCKRMLICTLMFECATGNVQQVSCDVKQILNG